ncbi:hypothetical protein RhiirA4_474103 [Rhizophagus irregularis]|uniref:Protein kinase domain-containing protein n=1 Tax=Rhizophagus irregularis TaxID=588596 RepID=A0A2I1H7V7_9GLOM|nr:hypothetical protein RhiirA4_474103 [Rhizophagus irregularis]
MGICTHISTGIESIHEHDLVHGHLHGENILIESEINSDAKIADTGLHGPVYKQISSEQIYGVIPFVAPVEVQYPKNLIFIASCLGNWFTTICDSIGPTELLNQFGTAEEIKFASLENLIHNNVPSLEKAIYSSRPLNSINIESPIPEKF